MDLIILIMNKQLTIVFNIGENSVVPGDTIFLSALSNKLIFFFLCIIQKEKVIQTSVIKNLTKKELAFNLQTIESILIGTFKLLFIKIT